jgi:ATP-dependent DNA ligase
MARRDAGLLTRNGHDFAVRFPIAAAAVATLPARSCLTDGEAIVTDQNGLAVFDLIRRHRSSQAAVLAPSTCLSSMVRICVANRSKTARAP